MAKSNNARAGGDPEDEQNRPNGASAQGPQEPALELVLGQGFGLPAGDRRVYRSNAHPSHLVLPLRVR